MASKHVTKVTMSKFKEHGRVVRFKEDNDGRKVGSVYVDKDELKKMGNPGTVEVTVSAA